MTGRLRTGLLTALKLSDVRAYPTLPLLPEFSALILEAWLWDYDHFSTKGFVHDSPGSHGSPLRL